MDIHRISQITKQVVKYIFITTYVRMLGTSCEVFNIKAVKLNIITNKTTSFKLPLPGWDSFLNIAIVSKMRDISFYG